MEISVLAAFLGGALALLSPCGALLLPGYFAFSGPGGDRAAGAGRLVQAGARAGVRCPRLTGGVLAWVREHGGATY